MDKRHVRRPVQAARRIERVFHLDAESPLTFVAGSPILDTESDVVPTLAQLQDAADAHGAPGPLDGFPDVAEEEPEFDLFEAAKGIRKAAYDFNTAVCKALSDGQIAVVSSTREDGTIWIDTIKLEVSL